MAIFNIEFKYIKYINVICFQTFHNLKQWASMGIIFTVLFILRESLLAHSHL